MIHETLPTIRSGETIFFEYSRLNSLELRIKICLKKEINKLENSNDATLHNDFHNLIYRSLK